MNVRYQNSGEVRQVDVYITRLDGSKVLAETPQQVIAYAHGRRDLSLEHVLVVPMDEPTGKDIQFEHARHPYGADL